MPILDANPQSDMPAEIVMSTSGCQVMSSTDPEVRINHDPIYSWAFKFFSWALSSVSAATLPIQVFKKDGSRLLDGYHVMFPLHIMWRAVGLKTQFWRWYYLNKDVLWDFFNTLHVSARHLRGPTLTNTAVSDELVPLADELGSGETSACDQKSDKPHVDATNFDPMVNELRIYRTHTVRTKSNQVERQMFLERV